MEKSIVSNECRIVYDLTRNGDKPAIAFLHGYGVNRSMWQPQMEFLKDKYTLINIDVRGHGQSRPCSSFSIRQAAEDLCAVLQAEQCENAVLVGLSMGGYVVQEYAFTYGGASGYFIAGSAPILLPCYSGFERFVLRHSAGMMKLYPWNTLKNQMTNACAVTEQARKLIRPMFDGMSKKEFVQSWDGMCKCLHEEQMQFDAPLMVTCGEEDKTGSILKCMKYWKQNYNGCETKIFEHAGHVVNLDQTQEFNRTLLDFIHRCVGQHETLN